MVAEEKIKLKVMQKKRIPPLFKLTMKTGAKIELIYNHPKIKKVVLDELIKAIKEGILCKSKSVNLFQVADSEFVIEIERENWKKSLSRALSYFTDEEDYTKCIEIREMIKEL